MDPELALLGLEPDLLPLEPMHGSPAVTAKPNLAELPLALEEPAAFQTMTPVAGPSAASAAATVPPVAQAAAPTISPPPNASASAASAGWPQPTQAMDRDFIARNQIVERYLSGRLPVKGATEFERFCADNPTVLDELGLPERVNAGLRLLEAAGKPEPWQEEPRKLWEKPPFVLGLAGAVLALLVVVGVLWNSVSRQTTRIAKLQKVAAEQPLNPATATRSIRLLPSYSGSSNTPAIVIGGGETQLADLKIDLSRSQYRTFRITIDRIDQGRVGILHNLGKDSNGHVRIALNNTALGPGNYQFTIEGLTWKGDAVPEAWVTIGIVH